MHKTDDAKCIHYWTTDTHMYSRLSNSHRRDQTVLRLVRIPFAYNKKMKKKKYRR